jgi:hypothetical protein
LGKACDSLVEMSFERGVLSGKFSNNALQHAREIVYNFFDCAVSAGWGGLRAGSARARWRPGDAFLTG